MAELVSEQGGDPIVQPAITIGPPDDWSPVDDAISRIGEFDWLVFSSANGVRRFMDRLFELGRDSRAIGSAKLCAIGPRTSDALCDYGLRCDRLPEEYRAESLAESLIADAKGKRFLLLRASRGREVLAETLRAAGGDVTQIVVYTSTDVQAVDDALKNQLANGEVDWVTVTSSAIAKSLASVYGDALKNAKLASISPITSETLRAQGFEPTVEATEYTTAGVISAMCDHNEPTSND